ncbi:Uncharacterised protein [Mycobacteroides abscessus subsp. abscessus]|nr:Uncharacterised protein [Mycobacteroides abscessus subsp. abscessus]
MTPAPKAAITPSLDGRSTVSTRVVMTTGSGGGTYANGRFSSEVAAHAVAYSSRRAVMYANTMMPSTGPNVDPAGPCMITLR